MSTPFVLAPSWAWWLIRAADVLGAVGVVHLAGLEALAPRIATPSSTRGPRVRTRSLRAADAVHSHESGHPLTLDTGGRNLAG